MKRVAWGDPRLLLSAGCFLTTAGERLAALGFGGGLDVVHDYPCLRSEEIACVIELWMLSFFPFGKTSEWLLAVSDPVSPT
jgi:hypothetical protein